jgi:uncharacterized protein (DUF2147 family)
MPVSQPLWPTSRRALVALGLALPVLCASAQNAANTDPRGRWITASGNLEVEVAACGRALCGTVTQTLANRSMRRNGAVMEAADARPALGMKILRDFLPSESDGGTPTQWSGEIYNRENGKTYRCRMTVSTDANPMGELVLHAYVGIPLFGMTQRWSRAAAESASTR